MHSNLSGPTNAVCYREVFTIRGDGSSVLYITYMFTVHAKFCPDVCIIPSSMRMGTSEM